MRQSAEQLLVFLEELAAEHGGSIPFERFMREALYHPDFGYHTANISTVGRRGDFSTAATLSDALGKGIASWIEARASELGFDREVPVIELGAGDGSLAETVLKSVGWRRRRRLRFHIVEISTPLSGFQQRRLSRYRNVSWSETIEEALESCGGRALIFSNELVDAFPVVLAGWDGGSWQEARVAFDRESGLREIFKPLDVSRLDSTTLEATWPTGQRVEIHDSYRRCIQGWARQLQTGAVLTIDYGGTPAEIYRRRLAGTLRGYFRQNTIHGNGIYQRFGRQDLTADVNFDDLRRWGEETGLGAVEEKSQAEWLGEWASSCSSVDAMVDPEGAGGAFRVLEQRPL